MASVRPFFNSFVSLFLLFVHIGCFVFHTKTPPTKKIRKLCSSTSPSGAKAHRALSFINPWPYLKPLFLIKSPRDPKRSDNPGPILSSVGSSKDSCPAPTKTLSTLPRKRSSPSFSESDFSSDMQPKRSSFTFQYSDIFPCPTCGEIFQNGRNLEHHQSTKHAVTELLEVDSATNIVRIIFQTGWNSKENPLPNIHRILKINNSPKVLSRFEEYRESIKIKSSRNDSSRGRWNERCMVDGNELLRFQCSTFICSLGQKGNSGICGGEFCSVCGIIRSGFSQKLDGISTMGSSRQAHQAIPEEMEEEFGFMNVKRAMLVCRVVAGRVAREGEVDAVVGADKEDGGFDSVVVRPAGGFHRGVADSSEELLVFNPRAVLSCFVIIYTI